MRPFAATLLYLCFVFLGAALLAPWLFHWLQLAAMEFPKLRELAGNPFHRYLNRCMIALALIGLWPFLKALEVRSTTQLGFQSRAPFKELVAGLAWSLAIVAALGAIGLLSQAHHLTLSNLVWPKYLRNVIPAMFVVAVIEEILFRGGLFGALRRQNSFSTAALLSSAIYALAHFFGRPENPPQVEWHSGFLVLGQMCKGFTEWRLIFPAFVNLFLVGLILALAFEQTRAIYFSIGLHAGFIGGAKTFPFISDPSAQVNHWLWGSDKLIDGWAACLILFLMLMLFIRRGTSPIQNSSA